MMMTMMLFNWEGPFTQPDRHICIFSLLWYGGWMFTTEDITVFQYSGSGKEKVIYSVIYINKFKKDFTYIFVVHI